MSYKGKKKFASTILITYLCAAAATADQSALNPLQFRDDSLSPYQRVFEFVSSICGLGVGGIESSSKVHCESGKCTGEIKIQRILPHADVLLTPDFRLLFSKDHFFDQKSNRVETMSRAPIAGLERVEIRTLTEEVGIPKDEATNLANCIEKIGIAAQSDLGNQKKAVLNEELNSNPNESVILRNLEYAKANLSYPSSLEINETGILSITVIPSLRLQPEKYGSEIETLTKQQKDVILDHVRSNPNVLNKDSAISISEIYSGTNLVPVENRHQALSIEVRGVDLKQEALTPSTQILSPLIPSRWLWQIKPEVGAAQSIYLVLESSSVNEGEVFTQAIPISLQVNTSLTQQVKAFLSANWQWLAGTILIPLFLFWWQRLGKRRSPNITE